MQRVKVGVFDSGVGGQSVINAIKKEMPHLEIIYKDDKKHLPYGTKSKEQIYDLIKPIFVQFLREGCEVIVIACNTVTTNLIDVLRKEFSIPMVGVEPMVKPAAQNTKTGVIAVCATPRTLGSDRYNRLKEEYAKGIKVLEPNCGDWALSIENNRLNRDKVAKIIEDVLAKKADQIVLGCTHYHWIEDEIKELARGRAKVIQPEKAIVAQLRRVIEQTA